VPAHRRCRQDRAQAAQAETKYQLVTSANRIPLMANGTIDLECGSTTNNVERQKQVAFTITHFLTANRYVSKKSSNIKSIDDLKGKTIVSTSGTTNIKQVTELNTAKNMGMNIIPGERAPGSFPDGRDRTRGGFRDGRHPALHAGSQARSPGDYVISSDALSLPEPYGIMLRKDDPAFKKVVDNAMTQIYKSGEINKIYDKWFTRPVPPKGINYNVGMSPQFKNLIASPTDSGDPTVYK
jgi:glutamate/aspartate transport system substrate-binding protein